MDLYSKIAEDPKQDGVKNPRNPQELLLEQFWVPFFLTALKELKCDNLQLLMHPTLEALVLSFKLPKNSSENFDFTKMSTEQYYQFRHVFVEERMYDTVFAGNKGSKAMDLILSVLCMILCNKVPKNLVSFRPDSLASKIKLM